MVALPSFSALEHGAFVGTGLLLYFLTTRIRGQRRTPSSAMVWVMSMILLPYLAMPLFLVFGTRKFTRPSLPSGLSKTHTDANTPRWATRLLSGLGLPDPQGNTSVDFHADGPSALQALMALIHNAQHSLEVGTYILSDDQVGQQVANALIAAVQRGVRVRLLVDWMGSFKTPRSMWQHLSDSKVPVRQFMPLYHNPIRGKVNLRNHRKLLVADGAALWSGGRNLANEYFINTPHQLAWIDLSYVVRGPVAVQAQAQFEADWAAASGNPTEVPVPSSAHPPPHGTALAQWVPSGPDRADDTVYALLLTAAYHAKQRILAVTPYFVPDDALLDAWCLACRCGVQVHLVVPRVSNHRMADLARERALRRLVNAGGHVWLVEGMVHAKAVVIDTALAMCGSVNLDGRSLFLNYEAMAAFYTPAEIAWLAQWHAALIATAQPYHAVQPVWWRDILEGMVRSVGFQL